MDAEALSSRQASRAWIGYLVQLGVFALLAMAVPAAYAASGDTILTFGTFAGFPWSITLWFLDPQVVSPGVEQALVTGCAVLNVALLAALLRFAWVRTDRGAYTDSRNGTWKVCALAGGSLLLVAVASLGVLYTESLAPAVLLGAAVALMMPSAMYYLLPWRWVAHILLAVGICVALLWVMFAGLLVSLEHTAF